jgi:hypothetical protein
MAAAITTTATTLEGQLIEVAQAIEVKERAYNTANPTLTQVGSVSLSLDPENAVISVSVNMAATVSGTGGAVSMSPTAYLP